MRNEPIIRQPTPGTVAFAAYRALITACSPLLRAHLRARAGKGKEIAARLGERLGRSTTARPDGTLIWLHAASVGETVSILPVLRHLVSQTTGAQVHVLLTTGTVTAAELFTARLPGLGVDDRVIHQFAPLDVPAWTRAFLDHWRPDAAVFVESELWPARILALRQRGVPLMLLNGRMSAGSFRRWSRLRPLITPLLAAFHTIRARGAEDAARFAALGRPDAVAAGDLKLAAPALPYDAAEFATLTAWLGARPVFVAASTHPGEEALIAAAHAALVGKPATAPDTGLRAHPDLLTIIVPRHPERGAALAGELGADRRGASNRPPPGGLWIADTLGELGLWYRLAHVVFVGRSLLPPGGGQNPLEPARLGRAIAVGRYMGNFAEHVALLQAAQAVTEIADAAELAAFVAARLAEPEETARMGERARQASSGADDLPEASARAILALARVGEA
jgi:3-deoxy-D-manno-octulosonic-acid transferase